MNQLTEDFCRNNKGKILTFFMEQDFIGHKEKKTQEAGNPRKPVCTRSTHFEDQCHGVTHPEILTSFAPFWSELPGNMIFIWDSPIALAVYTPIPKAGEGQGAGGGNYPTWIPPW